MAVRAAAGRLPLLTRRSERKHRRRSSGAAMLLKADAGKAACNQYRDVAQLSGCYRSAWLCSGGQELSFNDGTPGEHVARSSNAIRQAANDEASSMPRTRCMTTLLIFELMLSGVAGLAQVRSPFRLDRSEYSATCIRGKSNTCSYAFTLVATYENRTPDTLYVSRCYPTDPTPMYDIEVADDTTEDAAYAPMWACVGHDSPIVIAPHAARVDTLQIEGPNSFNGKTNAPIGKFEGGFRLLYKVRSCEPGRTKCRPLPESERSATFRVHLVQ